MKELSNDLQKAKNSIEIATPWLNLLEIEIDGNTPLRVTDNNETVTFGGEDYRPFPFTISAINSDSAGKIPSITLTVSNVNNIIFPYVDRADGLIDTKVTLTVVNTAYLEEDYAELTLEFSILGATMDEEWASFTLGAPSPMRQRFPKDRYVANSCQWTFNSPTVRAAGTNAGAECAYQGSDTGCDKTYGDCKGKGNDARYGGFFGLSPNGFKVV